MGVGVWLFNNNNNKMNFNSVGVPGKLIFNNLRPMWIPSTIGLGLHNEWHDTVNLTLTMSSGGGEILEGHDN
jgi:hypothetical protein